jgi:hypothetical protein
MRTMLTSTLGLAAIALLGCGSDQRPVTSETAAEPPVRAQRLPAPQQRRAFEAQHAISEYCRRRALSLQSDEPPPSAMQAREALAAADRLVELARSRPFDLVQTGVDMRLYVGDLIEDLGNLSCDPALVRRLDEGLG